MSCRHIQSTFGHAKKKRWDFWISLRVPMASFVTSSDQPASYKSFFWWCRFNIKFLWLKLYCLLTEAMSCQNPQSTKIYPIDLFFYSLFVRKQPLGKVFSVLSKSIRTAWSKPWPLRKRFVEHCIKTLQLEVRIDLKSTTYLPSWKRSCQEQRIVV